MDKDNKDNIEKLIDSVQPKNEKERNKLRKALSQVRIYDMDSRRIVKVNKSLMGVIHQGDWYCWATLRNGQVVKVFEKGLKRELSCIRDVYGRYWYYMYYYDTAYDDIHFVYIGVNNPDEAESLYSLIGLNVWPYIDGYDKSCRFPFFRLNVSDYMTYGTEDLTTTPEQYMEQLLINNDLLL